MTEDSLKNQKSKVMTMNKRCKATRDTLPHAALQYVGQLLWC